jgi:hypothetical protein
LPTWNCIIPNYDLISPNRLLRMKWFVRDRFKEEAISRLVVYGSPYPQYPGKVRMVIARMYGKRQRDLDTDNLYGGCKLLIDAMKMPKGRSRRCLSIIREDNPSMLDLRVVQFKGAAEDCEIGIWTCPWGEALDIPEQVAKLIT